MASSAVPFFVASSAITMLVVAAEPALYRITRRIDRFSRIVDPERDLKSLKTLKGVGQTSRASVYGMIVAAGCMWGSGLIGARTGDMSMALVAFAYTVLVSRYVRDHFVVGPLVREVLRLRSEMQEQPRRQVSFLD
jgi:hypothetical protein